MGQEYWQGGRRGRARQRSLYEGVFIILGLNLVSQHNSNNYGINVVVLISALCAYTVPESNRAGSHLSNGGFELKIGQFLAELWPFLSNLLGFCTKMAVSSLIMVRFSIKNHRWKALDERNHLQKAGVRACAPIGMNTVIIFHMD